MRNHLKSTVSVAILATFLATGAQASDLGSSKDSSDTVVNYQAKTNWTGLYLGGAVGWGNSNHDLSVRDYFKDYCDNVRYKQDGIVDSSDDKFEDLSRGLNFSADDLLGCVAPDPAPTNGALLPLAVEPGDSREIARLDGLNANGLVGDVRVGADIQRGRFVGGVFASYGFSQMEANGSGFGSFSDFALERGDDWSVGARAGILVNDRTLLYILAAYTETEYEFSGTFNDAAFSETTTFSGVTVGGGIEFAATNNVFLGLEATHTFYGDEDIFDNYDPETNVGTLINDDLSETKIMGTLKIKLNSGLLGN